MITTLFITTVIVIITSRLNMKLCEMFIAFYDYKTLVIYL